MENRREGLSVASKKVDTKGTAPGEVYLGRDPGRGDICMVTHIPKSSLHQERKRAVRLLPRCLRVVCDAELRMTWLTTQLAGRFQPPPPAPFKANYLFIFLCSGDQREVT